MASGEFGGVGLWWLPERTRDEAVQGRLSFHDDRDFQLELYGSLDRLHDLGETVETEDGTVTRLTEDAFKRADFKPRVVGTIDGQGFTLEDCYVIRRAGFLVPPGRVTLRVTRVYEGVHLEAGEPTDFNQITVKMDGLAEWLGRSGITRELHFEGKDEKPGKPLGATLSVKELESVPIPTDEAYAEASFEHTWNVSNQAHLGSISEDAALRIDPGDPSPVRELLEAASDVQALVSLGLDRNAAFTEISLRHADLEPEDGRPSPTIKLHARWQVEAVDSKPGVDEPFKLARLGGAATVGRWLTVAGRHRRSLSRAIGAWYSTSMYASDRLLNRASALESLDRDRHQDEIYFRDRVLRIADPVGPAFGVLVGDVNGWATALRDARNDVAHHNPEMYTSPGRLFFVGESAMWLLVLSLLSEARVDGEALDAIVNSRRLKWISESLEEAYPDGYPNFGGQ